MLNHWSADNTEQAWYVFWAAVGITAIIAFVSCAMYWSVRDYARQGECVKAGGVAISVSDRFACAHIDRFIELPGLR